MAIAAAVRTHPLRAAVRHTGVYLDVVGLLYLEVAT
jgi:hypothetical protein